jgi:hypothetical protein
MRPPPKTLAEAAQRSLATTIPLAVCLDEFLDAFYTEPDPQHRQAMIDAEPARTGSERDDAYLGAVGEHLARVWGLRIPEWTDAAWRVVADPWFVGSMGVGLSGLFLVESPIAFRCRRIFTEADPLRRARMPAYPG